MRKLCGASFRDAVCPAPSGGQIASAPADRAERVRSAGSVVQTARASAGGIDREQVREIQELLARHGYDPGPADGLMGPRTRGAIEQFQRDTGRNVTGEPNAAVLAALQQHRARATAVAAASATPTPPAARPASTAPSPTSERIREFQTLLAALDYNPGPADAVMRRSLQDAIRAFEQSHDLTPTGVPSEVLLALLRVSANRVLAGPAEPAPRQAPPAQVPAKVSPAPEAPVSETVRAIQALLKQFGFDPGPADGIDRPATRQAIEAFQRAQGLAVTGEATPDLLLQLMLVDAAP